MTDTTTAARPRNPSVARELAIEHGALVRRLAQLQHRVSEQLQASARRQAALEAENMRLRAELMKVRTAVAWDLRALALVSRPAPAPRGAAPVIDPSLREAQAVICQTGCAGHAHPWLDADGQCRRTGQACDHAADAADGVAPAVASR